MAEFDIILTQKEQLELVLYFLSNKAVLVPYLAYEKPEHVIITDPSLLQKIINSKDLYGPIFVSWQDYEAYQYKYDEIKKENGIRYFLKQRHGGPYMDFLPCRMIKNEGREIITSGFVAYYRMYIIEELRKEIPVCTELKDRYRATTAYLRKKTTCFKAGSRNYWIGNEAIRFLKTGGFSSVEHLNI